VRGRGQTDRRTDGQRAGRALAAIAGGGAAGGTLLCVFLFLVYDTARGAATARVDLLLAGALAALLAAALSGWALARGFDSWHRAIVAASALLGALLVAALTIPADVLVPRYGLLLLAAAGAAVGGAAWWRLGRVPRA
jgi:hypothetical protein